MSTKEAFWRAIPLLESITAGRTSEQARTALETAERSNDKTGATLLGFVLEAAEILALLTCGTCQQPIRRPRREDGLDPRDFEWVHKDGSPVCDGSPVATLEFR